MKDGLEPVSYEEDFLVTSLIIVLCFALLLYLCCEPPASQQLIEISGFPAKLAQVLLFYISGRIFFARCSLLFHNSIQYFSPSGRKILVEDSSETKQNHHLTENPCLSLIIMQPLNTSESSSPPGLPPPPRRARSP